MAQTHVVEPGEHISGIAARFGFGDFHRILDQPENAALKQLRPDPHVLFPGDKVFIPERQDKSEQSATTLVHTFELDDLLLLLPLKVHDLGDKPVAKAKFELRLQFMPQPLTDTTDEKGALNEPVSRLAKDGELRIQHQLPPLADKQPRVEQYKFDLRIGGLNPRTTFSGQQQRLNNMGYFAGFALDDLEQMQWAVEEFQCDHMQLKPPRKPPVILPESDDPAANTGVQDEPTQKKIEKLHGI